MLQYEGEVLGVEHRRVELEGRSPFEVTTVHVLSGLDKQELRVSRDAEMYARGLTRGELIVVPVAVSAYVAKGGSARAQLTMLAPALAGARAEG